MRAPASGIRSNGVWGYNVVVMPKYIVSTTDTPGDDSTVILASTVFDAVQVFRAMLQGIRNKQYVEPATEVLKPVFMRLYVFDVDDAGRPKANPPIYESFVIHLDPPKPPCIDGRRHAWIVPRVVVGGDANTPGVRKHGRGCIETEICAHCGYYRVSDSWVQDPWGGQQRFETVEYRLPDIQSLSYLLRVALLASREEIDGESANAFDQSARELLGVDIGILPYSKVGNDIPVALHSIDDVRDIKKRIIQKFDQVAASESPPE